MAKITRALAKLFAGQADNNGQFGSAVAGTKTETNDPDIIQNLPAWGTGWEDATVGGKRVPALEEMQGLQYVSSYHINYLLQQGIAEWHPETNYFENSVVLNGTVLYRSLTNDNLNNALTDGAHWLAVFDGRYAAPQFPFIKDLFEAKQMNVATYDLPFDNFLNGVPQITVDNNDLLFTGQNMEDAWLPNNKVFSQPNEIQLVGQKGNPGTRNNSEFYGSSGAEYTWIPYIRFSDKTKTFSNVIAMQDENTYLIGGQDLSDRFNGYLRKQESIKQLVYPDSVAGSNKRQSAKSGFIGSMIRDFTINKYRIQWTTKTNDAGSGAVDSLTGGNTGNADPARWYYFNLGTYFILGFGEFIQYPRDPDSFPGERTLEFEFYDFSKLMISNTSDPYDWRPLTGCIDITDSFFNFTVTEGIADVNLKYGMQFQLLDKGEDNRSNYYTLNGDPDAIKNIVDSANDASEFIIGQGNEITLQRNFAQASNRKVYAYERMRSLHYYFSKGVSLQMNDGAGVTWVIKPLPYEGDVEKAWETNSEKNAITIDTTGLPKIFVPINEDAGIRFGNSYDGSPKNYNIYTVDLENETETVQSDFASFVPLNPTNFLQNNPDGFRWILFKPEIEYSRNTATGSKNSLVANKIEEKYFYRGQSLIDLSGNFTVEAKAGVGFYIDGENLTELPRSSKYNPDGFIDEQRATQVLPPVTVFQDTDGDEAYTFTPQKSSFYFQSIDKIYKTINLKTKDLSWQDILENNKWPYSNMRVVSGQALYLVSVFAAEKFVEVRFPSPIYGGSNVYAPNFMQNLAVGQKLNVGTIENIVRLENGLSIEVDTTFTGNFATDILVFADYTYETYCTAPNYEFTRIEDGETK